MVKYLIVTIFSVLYMSLILSVSAQQPKCKGQDLKMNDMQTNRMKECLQEVGAATPNDVAKEKMPCYFKCGFKGMLDDKGQPIKDEIVKDFEMMIPDDAKPGLQSGVAKCFEDPAASKVDPNEANCMGYEAFGNCIFMAFMESCK